LFTTIYHRLKPKVKLRPKAYLKCRKCLNTGNVEVDGNHNGATPLIHSTYYPEFLWNTFFGYRQLQLTAWQPPPLFWDFSPGTKQKGLKPQNKKNLLPSAEADGKAENKSNPEVKSR
jgi:hypothetical protein